MVKANKRDKSKRLHSLISEVVHGIIPSGNFTFNPPQSDTWQDVQRRSDPKEKDRLEFLGDAVMHLALAYELHRLYPRKSAGFYTNVRSALSTNITFMLLMKKAGLDRGQSGKPVADEFESMVAALFLQDGLETVMQWLSREFAPLIAAAERRFNQGEADRGQSKKSIPLGHKKYATASIKHSKKLRNMKVKRMKIQENNGRRRSAVVVIDLTLTDDESNNEDEVAASRSSSPEAGPSRLRPHPMVVHISDDDEQMASPIPKAGPSRLREVELNAAPHYDDGDSEDDQLYTASPLVNAEDQTRKKAGKKRENDSDGLTAGTLPNHDAADDSDGSEDSLLGSTRAVVSISRSWLEAQRQESRDSDDGGANEDDGLSCSMSISTTSTHAPSRRRRASKSDSTDDASSQEADVQEISGILLVDDDDEEEEEVENGCSDVGQGMVGNMLDHLQADPVPRRLASRLTSPSNDRALRHSSHSVSPEPRTGPQRYAPEVCRRKTERKSLRSRLTSPVVVESVGTSASKPRPSIEHPAPPKLPSDQLQAPSQGTADDPIVIDD